MSTQPQQPETLKGQKSFPGFLKPPSSSELKQKVTERIFGFELRQRARVEKRRKKRQSKPVRFR